MRMYVVLPLLLAAFVLYAEPTTTRQKFLQLVDRPRVALNPQLDPNTAIGEGLDQQRFQYNSELGERVPGILVKQASLKTTSRLPVVIVLHGTGGSKDASLPYLRILARNGFLAIAIDGRYHGERRGAESINGKSPSAYSAAMIRRYHTGSGLPFLYDTVWDILRLLDYLETRPDVDTRNIGAIGFSKGGMELYLAAAVDERIRVAVPCIGLQSFRWALDHDAWQSRVGTFQAAVDDAARDRGVAYVDANVVRKFYDRVAPGVYTEFDGPRMAPLIAPRPLLVINGDSDARTPLPGLMECVDAARAAYKDSDAFEFLLQPNTGHKVTAESFQKAVQWCVRWLR